jgi:hypothetical protein
MSKITELKTKNKKIIDFYERYPQLDFESVNLIIINLYEKMLDASTGELNNLITNQILNDIKQQSVDIESFKNEMNKISIMQNMNSNNFNSEINMIKEMINKMNNEISNNIITKLFDIKQLYTDDLKIILSNSQNDNINKIINKIEKENNIIIDKTNNVLHDLLPKSFNTVYDKYQNIIFEFKNDIKNTIDNIKISTDNLSLDKINDVFENKYNNFIQTINQNLINFISLTEDRLNNNINDIKNITVINQNSQQLINDQLVEYLAKYKNSSFKGQIGEHKLEFILNKIFINSDIIRTSNKNNSGDFIVKRDDKPTILFENKDYNHQVDRQEIIKFINDVQNNDCHGIFLSQYSSIATKKNYQIENHKGKILIYIQFVEYNTDKISVAVDIIDDLVKKLFNVHNNNLLTDEILEHINNEYSIFATKKENLMTYLRENNKKTLDMLNEIELPSLATYLASKFAITKLNNFVCDICNDFIGKNRMSLASHKKKCKGPVDNNSTNDNTENSIDDNTNDIPSTNKKSKK